MSQAVCDEFNELLASNDLGALIGYSVVISVDDDDAHDAAQAVVMVAETVRAIRAMPVPPRVELKAPGIYAMELVVCDQPAHLFFYPGKMQTQLGELFILNLSGFSPRQWVTPSVLDRCCLARNHTFAEIIKVETGGGQMTSGLPPDLILPVLRRALDRLHDAISAAHTGQTIHDVPFEIVDWGSSGASTPAGAPADAQAASPGVGAGGGVASSGAREDSDA